jgi:phosphatidylglycerophosphate synthase
VGAASEAARDRPTLVGARTAEAAPTAVIFVPAPHVWQRDATPGGLSLLERQLKQLRKLAVAVTALLVPAGDPEPRVAIGVPPIVRVPRSAGGLTAALAAAVDQLPPACLALSANLLIDPRVLRALLARAVSTFASVDGVHAREVAWVHAADVRRRGAALSARAARLPLADLDPYAPELRGNAVPYVVGVDSPEERRIAWRILLDAVQKRSLDLPGQYFDTPFENFLVRRLAPTSITPNQITLATLVVAAGVAWLFSQGWLRLGVVIALVVGVLDGVDGKLARLKLATSKLGELEHVGDFFYENSWYLTLAWYLRTAAGLPSLWYAGLSLVLFDLSDSLLYLVLQRHTGKMLDELTTFDRRFRAVAGRRNVYVWFFVVGFWSGHAAGAFVGATTWAGITVLVHAVRVTWVLATVPARS